MKKTTRIDETHTFEEFGFIPLFAQSQQKNGTIKHLTQEIPGRSGAWLFGSEIGTKAFEVPLAMIEENDLIKERKIDNLVAFFLDGKGRPRPVKMSFRRTPDKFIWAMYSGMSDPNYSAVTADLILHFEQTDPNRYSTADAYDPEKPLKYDEGNPYGSKSYPNTDSFKWMYVPHHYAGIENYSSLDTDIRITITGTVKGGSIKHMQSGNKLHLPDVTNGKIIVDTESFNIKLNGQDILEFEGDFFEMVEGSNGFDFSAASAKADVVFEWFHKFS